MKNLADIIGIPALLELTGEESSELTFAVLKYARYLRNENKVYGRTEEEMKYAIAEECADLLICMEDLKINGIINDEILYTIKKQKQERLKNRLGYEYKE